MKWNKSLINLFIIFCTTLLNCMDVPRDNAADKSGDNYDGIYSDNRITEFRFGDLQVNGVINDDAGTIVVPVLYGSDVTALAPEFTTNAESVIISGREQRSGITVNDYSGSVVYEVTARDGSYREYTVSIREVSIVSFRLIDPALPWENGTDGVINYDNNTIYVPVPFYMNITRLVVTFNSVGALYIGTEEQVSGVTERDFTDAEEYPLIYEVEDENGVSGGYTVTVACAEAAAAHFAGSMGGVGSTDGTGSAAAFRYPFGITSDMNNIYVADQQNHTIRKIEISTGVVTTLAGSPSVPDYVDATGSEARFNNPTGITTDGVDLYVTDRGSHTIRKIVISTGAVTTIAGTAGTTGSGTDSDNDITNITSTFNFPSGITTDGVNLYVTDTNDNMIRQIVISSGDVSNITVSGVDDPYGITTDGTYLYIADSNDNEILQVKMDGSISNTWTDIVLPFDTPYGIATDGKNLYVSDTMNHLIRKIVISSGAVSTFAGSALGHAEGIGTAAEFNNPKGITLRNGVLFVADSSNHTIRTISEDRMTGTLAGCANESGADVDDDDGTGTAARFTYPQSVTTDGTDLYISENTNIIRKVSISTGAVSTFKTLTGSTLRGITTDGTYLYACDIASCFIYKISISTGDAENFASGCGQPYGITTDGTNLYVTDNSNHIVRKIVISTEEASTIAGLSGVPGSTDGTTLARFYNPAGITTDGTNLYVADSRNNTVRQILISTGVVSTIAGSAAEGGHEDDPDGYTGNIDSRLKAPAGITTDGANLYVSETTDGMDFSNVIRKIVISSGVVTTLSGTYNLPGCNDGPASAALFNSPVDLVFSVPDKKLYVCDQGNHAVRVLNP